jgi:hypothetical protein
MSEVRQAHMPGNYELYDPSGNKLGPVICKLCWEKSGIQNHSSLNTVWVSVEDRRMVWWLCGGHELGLKSEGGPARFLRSSKGVLANPGI